jgi:hypothetical protein
VVIAPATARPADTHLSRLSRAMDLTLLEVVSGGGFRTPEDE